MCTLKNFVKYVIINPLVTIVFIIIALAAGCSIATLVIFTIGLTLAAIPTMLVLAVLCAPIYGAFVLGDAIYEHIKINRQIKETEDLITKVNKFIKEKDEVNGNK